MINKKKRIDAIKWALISFLILRGLSIVIVAVLASFPIEIKPTFSEASYAYNELSDINNFSKNFLAPWFRWDTVHYLEISQHGYDYYPSQSAWPPLYPFLIKLLSFVIHPPILSAISLSNLFCILAFYELFLFTFEMFDEYHAKRAVLFMVFFPSAFYLVAGYSESLFLFLTIVCFRYIQKEKWASAGILCGLATFCRVQGILLLIPIVIKAFEQKKKESINLNFLPSLLIAPFAYGLFSLYSKFGLRQNWPWKALLNNWELHFGWPWEGIFGNITAIFTKTLSYQFSLPVVQFINLSAVIFSIYLLVRFWKKFPLWLNVYNLLCLILFLSKVDNQSILVSTVRYLISIFPIFISLSFALRNKYSVYVYTAIAIIMQSIMLSLFYFWAWAA